MKVVPNKVKWVVKFVQKWNLPPPPPPSKYMQSRQQTDFVKCLLVYCNICKCIADFRLIVSGGYVGAGLSD